mgnify:CR=1 FL=1
MSPNFNGMHEHSFKQMHIGTLNSLSLASTTFLGEQRAHFFCFAHSLRWELFIYRSTILSSGHNGQWCLWKVTTTDWGWLKNNKLTNPQAVFVKLILCGFALLTPSRSVLHCTRTVQLSPKQTSYWAVQSPSTLPVGEYQFRFTSAVHRHVSTDCTAKQMNKWTTTWTGTLLNSVLRHLYCRLHFTGTDRQTVSTAELHCLVLSWL